MKRGGRNKPLRATVYRKKKQYNQLHKISGIHINKRQTERYERKGGVKKVQYISD